MSHSLTTQSRKRETNQIKYGFILQRHLLTPARCIIHGAHALSPVPKASRVPVHNSCT